MGKRNSEGSSNRPGKLLEGDLHVWQFKTVSLDAEGIPNAEMLDVMRKATGAALLVWSRRGSGRPESSYEQAMAQLLQRRGFKVEMQLIVQMPMTDVDGAVLDRISYCKPDLVVSVGDQRRLVIELKVLW